MQFLKLISDAFWYLDGRQETIRLAQSFTSTITQFQNGKVLIMLNYVFNLFYKSQIIFVQLQYSILLAQFFYSKITFSQNLTWKPVAEALLTISAILYIFVFFVYINFLK